MSDYGDMVDSALRVIKWLVVGVIVIVAVGLFLVGLVIGAHAYG